jgi:hypothetical protein
VSKTLSAGDEVGDGQNRLSQGQRVAVETSPRYCVQLLGCVVPHLHRWLSCLPMHHCHVTRQHAGPQALYWQGP